MKLLSTITTLLLHHLLISTTTNATITNTDIKSKRWSELGRGIGEEDLHDLTGYSVASNAAGSVIAIGSPYHNDNHNQNYNNNYNDNNGASGGAGGKHSGRVRVYEYDELNNKWTKIGQDIVGETGDLAGFAVSLSVDGYYLAVGAPKCSRYEKNEFEELELKKEKGCVRVYERTEQSMNGKVTTTFEKLGGTILGSEAFDEFGTAVKIHAVYSQFDGGFVGNNDTQDKEDIEVVQVAIGAPGAKNTQNEEVGHAYFVEFKMDGSVAWSDQSRNIVGEDFVGEGTPNSRFGSSIGLSIDDAMMVVGAPNTKVTDSNMETMVNAGKVHLFARQQNDAGEYFGWEAVTVDGLNGQEEGAECGASVSMTLRGDYIGYGCPSANLWKENKWYNKAGKVEVRKLTFEAPNYATSLVDVPIYGENGGDLSGFAIDIGQDQMSSSSNVYIAIGAPNNYPSEYAFKAGHVRVYHLDQSDKWIRANLDIDGSNSFDELGSSVAVSYDGHRIVTGAPGDIGYAKIFELSYTQAPSLAPTNEPTKASKPWNGPAGGNGNTDNSTNQPLWLLLLVLFLIPTTMFAVFKTVLYWRARSSYRSRFGADVQINAPRNDLELTRGVESAVYRGVESADQPLPTQQEPRDII